MDAFAGRKIAGNNALDVDYKRQLLNTLAGSGTDNGYFPRYSIKSLPRSLKRSVQKRAEKLQNVLNDYD